MNQNNTQIHNRQDVFGWIKQENGLYSIPSMAPTVGIVQEALENVAEIYTRKSDEEAYSAFKGGFKGLFKAATSVQLSQGMCKREPHDFIPREQVTMEGVLSGYVQERNYQETRVREQYGTQGKIFTGTQEIAMCVDYLQAKRNPTVEAFSDNARKIGAMALRWLENNFDKDYSTDLVL